MGFTYQAFLMHFCAK